MPNSTKNSTLSKDELLTFLESYRNVIEFNTQVLEEIKAVSSLAKNVNDELSEYHHKLDIVSKDIFFKFEVIVNMLNKMEMNYGDNRNAIDELRKIKKYTEDLKELAEEFRLEAKKGHRDILSNVRIGWISMATFFTGALAGIGTLAITYYKEVAIIHKLLEYFGIK